MILHLLQTEDWILTKHSSLVWIRIKKEKTGYLDTYWIHKWSDVGEYLLEIGSQPGWISGTLVINLSEATGNNEQFPVGLAVRSKPGNVSKCHGLLRFYEIENYVLLFSVYSSSRRSRLKITWLLHRADKLRNLKGNTYFKGYVSWDCLLLDFFSPEEPTHSWLIPQSCFEHFFKLADIRLLRLFLIVFPSSPVKPMG
jgi:hypothetical protein